MAKVKQQSLSIEEKLKQTLVPEDEQPYEVPGNWVWMRLGDICKLTNGEKQQGVDLPYLEAKVLRGKVEAVSKKAGLFISKGSKVILVDGENSGEVFHVDIDGYMGSTFKLLNIADVACDDFVEYFISKYKDNFRNSKVGSAIPHLNKNIFYSLNFPFPPLVEQQRIVDRIESLFEKLDNAKELAQNALDTFETRKAAILHKAFTGQLTKRGNKQEAEYVIQEAEGVKDNLVKTKQIQKPKKIQPLEQSDIIKEIPKEWVYCKLGEIAFVTKLAGFEYTKYIHLEEKGEIPVIRAQNVRMGYLDTTNLLYIDKKISEQLNRSALYKKSLLVTFIGAGIGDICIFDKKERFHLAPNVAKVELYNDDIENILPEYVLYYLLSHYGQKQIFKHLKATAQPSLSMETIRDIVIPIPALSEQKEIVRLLDNIFQKEEEAEELCAVIDKIDLMKKAILARAFRGELGTNNPKEESAIELLKEVLAKEQ